MNPLNPQPTPFDLCWRLFGIHFRVHPGFWVFSGVFGYQMSLVNDQVNWSYLFTWIGCTFFSVLIHELGHVVMGRMCGQPGNIFLHSLGGAAVGDYLLCRRWQQMAIALSGPAAGLLLFGTVWMLVVPEKLGFLGLEGPRLLNKVDPAMLRPWLWKGVHFLLLMTFMWNVINLLPVLPMDGGQVVRASLAGEKWPTGMRLALGLSFVLAAFIAVYSYMAYSDPRVKYPMFPSWITPSMPGEIPFNPFFNMIIFAALAVQNFIALLMVKSSPPTHDDEPPQEEYPDQPRDY